MLPIRLTTWALRSASTAVDLVGVGQQVTQLRVALVERLGEPGHALHRDPEFGGVSANVSDNTLKESDN